MSQPAPWTPIPQDVSLLPVLRALEECHTQVGRSSFPVMEALGLTMPQFDVLVTLGDTSGMTTKDLGLQSLTTKGSLLPILERLEARGLIHRCKGTVDCRQTIVALTPEGQALYETAFATYLKAMRPRIDNLAAAEQAELVRLLKKLGQAFT